MLFCSFVPVIPVFLFIPSFVTIILAVLLVLFLIVSSLYGKRYFDKKVNEEVDKRVDNYIKVREKALQIKEGLDNSAIVKLKSDSKVASKKYDSVTVMFADIQGFTKIVEHLNPERLIDELDKFFVQFDMVVEKYKIEKIKTIGDAYMAAGGVPIKNSTNSVEVVMAALEIQRHMQQQKADHRDFWELRVGIHTGPVISGKVGRSKTGSDIWGDTVNIASRMESSGVAGQINITSITHQLVKDFFVCEYRGKMPIKYKGEIDMYFVKNILPELSEMELGEEPNELFRIRLQHIRFNDIEEIIISRLSTELSQQMYYHNAEHTSDMITQVEILGRGENVSEEDLLILKTAALMHDTGFLISYKGHETGSINLAKEILPTYQYTSEQIDGIVRLIEATRLGAKPSCKLEQIFRDADLDYLGRSDYFTISDRLYKELHEFDREMTHAEWLNKQSDFLTKHQYYTLVAKEMRQLNKDQHVEKLKALLLNAN
ncbi:MAG: hypothetical protein LBV41_12745 [Cytophagaceae bacterium]|nr:hypothetical protein [Cytophagaceae bacterium]